MKKSLFLFLLLGMTAVLSAAHSQFTILAMGKEAYLKTFDSGNAGPIREFTKWDRKTGTKYFQSLYFGVGTKNQKEVKKLNLKIETEKSDLIISLGNKRSDKLLWTSLKIDEKEQIKDPKKGELIGIKQFKIGKYDKKKNIVIEGTYRAPTKKELQADKNAAKKSAKKSKKSKK